MTERQTRLWILGTSAASGFAIGTAIMGIIDTIKDRRLKRKIDQMRDEIWRYNKELMEMSKKWNENNKVLLGLLTKETEA